MSNSIKQIISKGEPDTVLEISAWVRTKRESKKFSFFEINDGSCLSNLQVVFDADKPSYADTIENIRNGAAVRVVGKLVQSQGKGQSLELQAEVVEVVGASDPETYPLQKKRHSKEVLRQMAHLRPRTNLFGAVFRVRNQANYAVHKFFQEQGFIQVHSPIITTSDCEGAGEQFQVTTLDLNSIPKNDSKEVDYTKDFFSEQAHLTVSGQLEAEIFALAMKNVYTFGPTFRAENSNTPKHLAEFWMIEPEMAFCDLERDMQVAEDFTRYLIKHTLDNCEEDLALFDKWVEPGIVKSLESVASAQFEKMTYTEAIKKLQAAKKDFEFPVKWGVDIQTEHERYLSEELVKGPVFITNYPKEIKAFYMLVDEDEKTVSAMDLLVPRLGEIIGGSQREHRLDVLKSRIKDFNINVEHLDWYLDLRKFGGCPHAGFGMGFERLVMYLTGIENIRDVIPCPRTPGNARF